VVEISLGHVAQAEDQSTPEELTDARFFIDETCTGMHKCMFQDFFFSYNIEKRVQSYINSTHTTYVI
jgi:hypothetical protein